ncbi:MAG: acyl-CoA thioesterase [Bacteroidetes bacterium]|jgi:acyl-CoA thioester hydrolase|nr:acyl-CoA thioesterase [Bacteroidota bacterium]MBP7256176.1 acyl-CoA thioesterase [Chitinophagales bacterium]MBK7139231.1 acyl-CoA thioesterase [Bacteroidota bacterium]MBK7504632.1 acyl-CoA thioesterase [Bacteroidota bacterium]MBK7640087.1 acyl-CoA thioesterase [Bacteroidota bacterium]
MYISKSTIRVKYADVDAMGVVYHGNYAQFFEAGRAEAFRNLGYTYKNFEADGFSLPVVEMKTRFLKPAKYDDLITISTIIKTFPSRKLTIFTELYNELGELITNAEISFIFVKSTNMSLISAPEKFKAILLPFFKKLGEE